VRSRQSRCASEFLAPFNFQVHANASPTIAETDNINFRPHCLTGDVLDFCVDCVLLGVVVVPVVVVGIAFRLVVLLVLAVGVNVPTVTFPFLP